MKYSEDYERGKKNGAWSKGALEASGWIDSAKAEGVTNKKDALRRASQLCLAHCEEKHIENMEECDDLSPEFAEQQREYLQGSIDASRSSLRKLM